jgi:MGT family glycosyltransferase
LLRPIVTGTFERTMLPRLNRVRAAVGVPELGRTDDLYLRMPLLLYMTAEPFEYARSDWPANIVMVGPCVWEPPAPAPEWLASIDRPIVLVTTSSEFQDDGRLIATALRALADEPVHVVATVPAGAPADFPATSNAHVVRFIPHGPVLERAVCAITHGGMGATQKALARGVPVCAVPFGRDQLEVARRVEVARAGTRLPPYRLSASRLRAKVLEAMTCKDGAKRVAEGYTLSGGAVTAANAVEQRLLGRQMLASFEGNG